MKLSRREQQILDAMTHHARHTNKEIAAHTGIPLSHIGPIMCSMYTKLHVADKVELLQKIFEEEKL